jgi:hypothetical protein
MRLVIALFVALLAIPIAQVSFDRWNGRVGPRVLGAPAAGLAVMVGKHHRVRELEFLTLPKLDWRRKTG